MKKISIVVPCDNEAEVIEETYNRLTLVMTKLLSQLEFTYELIFVNDGSRDATLIKLMQFEESDHKIRVINFSRNFGHQIAVSAGIDHADGDAVVLIDADLQDPPELIVSLVDKWMQGYDVVYAIRQGRAGESHFKKLTAKVFYRLLHSSTNINIPLDTGDFRLMSRRVVVALRQIDERHRFIRGLVSWVGFKQTGIEYQRAERFAGESKYPLKKMMAFAIDGITSFSTAPLRLSSVIGLLSAVIGLIGILGVLYMRLFTTVPLPGWSSLMIVTLFLGGAQLMMIGLLGEYLGRVYDETRKRPLYIVQDYYGFESVQGSGAIEAGHEINPVISR